MGQHKNITCSLLWNFPNQIWKLFKLVGSVNLNSKKRNTRPLVLRKTLTDKQKHECIILLCLNTGPVQRCGSDYLAVELVSLETP
jgi:hypothetical protein